MMFLRHSQYAETVVIGQIYDFEPILKYFEGVYLNEAKQEADVVLSFLDILLLCGIWMQMPYERSTE